MLSGFISLSEYHKHLDEWNGFQLLYIAAVHTTIYYTIYYIEYNTGLGFLKTCSEAAEQETAIYNTI